ncbi:MAG TPA: SIS domain-containing protein [Candidatus Bathyarchaeia archaeon]
MSVDLDDVKQLSKIDRSNMLGAIDRFPDIFLGSRNEPHVSLKEARSSFKSLVLMGMGGSASAADVVLDWLKAALPIPAVVHREPGLPSFVDSRTLFIALSYSGETSETLVAFREAKKRGSSLVGIGHGGSLAEFCYRFKAPYIRVEASLAPRAALGQLIVAAAVALEKADLIRSTSREMSKVARELVRIRGRCRVETPLEHNPAKGLALKLLGHLPVLYALQRMSSVARRFKNQLAENSKLLAKYDLLPEGGHNEVEAWHERDNLLPVIIRDAQETAVERSILRAFRATISSASRSHPLEVRVTARGSLSKLLSPILLLDYVSVYLAMLRRIDPTPNTLINEYKKRMSR